MAGLLERRELRSAQFDFDLLHQGGADASEFRENVFVNLRLLLRGLQTPDPARVELRVEREELIEYRGGNQGLELAQMRFRFGLHFLGFLFVLIPAQRNLFLIEFLEWLEPLRFALLKFSGRQLGPGLLAHDGLGLGRQLRESAGQRFKGVKKKVHFGLGLEERFHQSRGGDVNLIRVISAEFPVLQKLLLFLVPIDVEADRNQDRDQPATDDAQPRIHRAEIISACGVILSRG